MTTTTAPIVRPVLSTSNLMRKVGAEMVATFALVFAGCGAIMVDRGSEGVIGHTGVGLTFGLVIMVMVSAIGHISGAHINPAVTIAFATTGRFPWKEVAPYVIGQLVAAMIAAATLQATLGPIADLGATVPSGTPTQSLFVEGAITFLLMFVIMGVATDARAVGQTAAWAIGGTVGLAAIFAGPISGASMNPARSLGPALISGQLDHIWVYIVGPLTGAILGAFTYRVVRCGGDEQAAGGCC